MANPDVRGARWQNPTSPFSEDKSKQKETSQMADKFVFGSAGLIHDLEMSMERTGGWSPTLVKRMCEGDRLQHIREYVLGYTEIRKKEHVINCDADPFNPENWKVVEHKRAGSFKWDPKRVTLWFSENQQGNKLIQGHKLREELADKPVLNVCVLDYLLAYPRLIPEEWKGKAVFFWGTIYANSDDNLIVRYLWYGGDWVWNYGWLDDADCGSDSPAALLAA